jgi:hypothetical protein
MGDAVVVMIDLKFIRNHPDQLRQLCVRRRAPVDVDQLLARVVGGRSEIGAYR